MSAAKTFIQEQFEASNALRMRAKSNRQLEDHPIEESKQEQHVEVATLAALPRLLRQDKVAGGPISPLT